MHVGVVGLGNMGSAIARTLLSQGYLVSVWNRSPEPLGDLVAAGAESRASLRELVEAVDAVIVMLWGDESAREVTLAQVIPAARAPHLIIEMSTLSPQMYETLENAATRRGVDFVAAPVLGGVDAAEQRTLTILAGGRRKALDGACLLLSSLGTVDDTGSVGASGYVKLANSPELRVL